MAEARNPMEPTMEEILASIRRIIVEDNGPLPAESAAAEQPADPLAPTRFGAGGPFAGGPPDSRVPGADRVARPFPAPPPNFGPSPAPRSPPVQEAILDLTERIDDEDSARDTVNATPASAPSVNFGRLNRPPPLKGGAQPEGRRPHDATLSNSIATLTKLAGIGQAARQPELPLGDVGRTLEEMVRELLRPHLKEWLDANLPRLVERLVRDEINRLVREIQER